MNLTTEILEAIKAHAEDSVPFESCGVITADGKVIRLENESPGKERSFLISASQFKRLERQTPWAGVYHSHVNEPPYISAPDFAGINKDGTLYIVVSVMNGVCNDFVASRLRVTQDGKKFEVISKAGFML